MDAKKVEIDKYCFQIRVLAAPKLVGKHGLAGSLILHQKSKCDWKSIATLDNGHANSILFTLKNYLSDVYDTEIEIELDLGSYSYAHASIINEVCYVYFFNNLYELEIELLGTRHK